jgi:hypothetical protein
VLIVAPDLTPFTRLVPAANSGAGSSFIGCLDGQLANALRPLCYLDGQDANRYQARSYNRHGFG